MNFALAVEDLIAQLITVYIEYGVITISANQHSLLFTYKYGMQSKDVFFLNFFYLKQDVWMYGSSATRNLTGGGHGRPSILAALEELRMFCHPSEISSKVACAYNCTCSPYTSKRNYGFAVEIGSEVVPMLSPHTCFFYILKYLIFPVLKTFY